MLVNISELIKNKINEKKLQYTLDIKDFYDGGEVIKILNPINFEGLIKVVDEQIIIEGKITGKIILTCSRCLDKFNHDIDINVNEKISINNDDKDVSDVFIDNSKLNLDDIIIDNIIMSLPVKKLCKKDCKGLCQICGTNLNYSQCNCKDEEIDPRLIKLKDFFSK